MERDAAKDALAAICEGVNRKQPDAKTLRAPLLKGIGNAQRQFKSGIIRAPDRWWKVSNGVVALTVKVAGDTFDINGVATNHMPEDRFVEFLDAFRAAVKAGEPARVPVRPFYFLFLGLWRPAVSLFGIAVLFILILDALQLPPSFDKLAWLGPAALYSATAIPLYYMRVREGLHSWNPFGLEASTVIGMRMTRLAAGGDAARKESELMVAEKVRAGLELQTQLALAPLSATPLGTTQKALKHYRRKVAANRRRLSR